MKFCLWGLGIGCVLSCQRLFIKPDPKSDPEQNFEMFWNDVNNSYPYFVEDHIDWDDRYKANRSYVTSSTSTEELYTRITGMLSGFSDGHLSVKYKDDYYENEKVGPEEYELVRADQSGALLTTTIDPIIQYFYGYQAINKANVDPFTYRVFTASNGVDVSSQDTICVYGTVDNGNILYINIASFLTDYPIDVLLQQIITKDPYSSAKGMILDLRMNGGGNLNIMWNTMGVFAPKGSGDIRYAYYKQKVGPLPTNFTSEYYYYVPANDNQQKYLKPVVVLTNRLTVSAAEHATMAMRQIKNSHPKIKIVGDYTFGATSFIVERSLPCGIQYTLVNSKTWDINHVLVERTGVKPDEQVFLTPLIEQGVDEQLERAITIINQDLF